MNSPYRPPIPEVQPSPALNAVDAPRPSLLDPIALALALSTPLSLWLLSPSRMTPMQTGTQPASPLAPDLDLTSGYGFSAVVLLISLLVTYYFWRGNNTARILILIGSALSIFNVLSIPLYADSLSKLYLVLDVAFCAYLVFWLSRAPVAAYFKSPKNAQRT